MTNAAGVARLFAEEGGLFGVSEEALQERLRPISAFVFDWDGVFNDGAKHDGAGSPFSEVDAMGTNLLRFSHHLHTRRMPLAFILSGEANEQALKLGQREHFHAVYGNAKDKRAALLHLKKRFALRDKEIAFFFDDVLDLPVAKVCGLRILVPHRGGPLFTRYAKENKLADYVTGSAGGSHAVREACEMVMGMTQRYDEALDHRARFSDAYRSYLDQRQRIATAVYTDVGAATAPSEKAQ